VDGRLDVYALGVVLFECLAGRLPCEATTLPELLRKIREGQVLPLADLRPELPADLVAIVARAMAVRKEDRFRSAGEFELALRSLPGVRPTDPYLAGDLSIPPPERFSLPPAEGTRVAERTLTSLAPEALPAEGLRTTHGPISQTQAPKLPKRGFLPYLVGGGAVVGVGLLVAFMGSTKAQAPPAPRPAPVVSAEPTARPSATPVVQPVATASAEPPRPSPPHVGKSATRPAALAPSVAVTAPSAAPVASAPPPPQPSNKLGLRRENPFAE
jgi:eukaryotic-like serine/threonine-protein kinase